MAASLTGLITRIEKNAGETDLPVELWQPQEIVQIDLAIDAQGQWYHQGQPFTRGSLVRLFSRLLRREKDGHYYLVTPVEKARVEVAEVPFIVVAADRLGVGDEAHISFTTQVSDRVPLDAEHPLRVSFSEADEPRPYVLVRPGLEARLLPQVFYQLVDWAEAEEQEGQTCLTLTSYQHTFELGCFFDS